MISGRDMVEAWGGEMKRQLCFLYMRSHWLLRLLPGAYALLGSGCLPSGNATSRLNIEVESLTGAHTRIVWVQDTHDRTDVFARGDRLRLMGFDSRDGRGERVVLAGPGSFAKPMLLDDGSTILFSDYSNGHVYRVDWEGEALVRLVQGRALEVWRDRGGADWVFVGTEPAQGGAPAYHRVTRHRVDDPDVSVHVWEGQPVGEDNFQVSADGRIAGGNFPWPQCGLMHLSEQRIEILGRGCWTSLAPDNSYRFWIFDGSHRNLLLFDTVSGGRTTIAVSRAPGIDGHEVYHPRWSNHPRIMTMTGPYTIRSGGNNIRGGGEDVEIYLGRFDEDFQTIEAWVQLTSNQWANFFPDVWVRRDDGGISDDAPVSVLSMDDIVQRAANQRVARESLPQPVVERVRARVVEASLIPDPADIAPYRRALVFHKYEAVDGPREGEQLLVAHWGILDARALPDARRPVGSEHDLTLVLFDDHPELEGERVVMDFENFLLDWYYDLTE